MEFKNSVEVRLDESLSRHGFQASMYEVEPIIGDLSPRKYYRIVLKQDKFQNAGGSTSLMAMVFVSIKPPEAETKIERTSDVSFLEITKFLDSNGIPVPEIYAYYPEIGVILLEDLGDEPLIEFVKKASPNVPQYYSQAIGFIKQIQNIENTNDFFIYKRSFDKTVYQRELTQFKDFVLPQGLSTSESKVVEKTFEVVCRELEGFEKVLVHRDFHSWNLMVDGTEKLRLIDYQDALMGVRCYDLVALLHERDIDLLLDAKLINDLESQFFADFKDTFISEIEYPITQLQRDIKVSGLFLRVKHQRGLESYMKWVNGTLKRIEITLPKLFQRNDVFSAFKNLLTDKGIFN